MRKPSRVLIVVGMALLVWVLAGCAAPVHGPTTVPPVVTSTEAPRATIVPMATTASRAAPTQAPRTLPTRAPSATVAPSATRAAASTRTLGAPSPGTPSSALAARGAVIFNTGRDPDGEPIPNSGGSMMMMTRSCASCHGPEGQGLSTPAFTSPNITYRNLTKTGGMIEPDGEQGMQYTDPLIRRAVTQGIDADGQALSPIMPRWQLTDAQWNELLAYLMALPD